jgi:hypothetical protein
LSFFHPEFVQDVARFDRSSRFSLSWLWPVFEYPSNTGLARVRALRTGNDPAGHAARSAANGIAN